MIRRLQVLNYRALKYIDIKLSEFQILIGPNASGKSTFLDVITMLKDILNEKELRTVIENRASSFYDLLWMKEGDKFEIAIELEIPEDLRERLKNKDFSLARYEVSLQVDYEKGIIINEENLYLLPLNYPDDYLREGTFFGKPTSIFLPKRVFYNKHKALSKGAFFYSEVNDLSIPYKVGPLKSSLAGLPEDEKLFPVALWLRNLLMEGIQFLQLDSLKMRWGCPQHLSLTFQSDGSNLPKVVKHLKENQPEFFSDWVEHIQTALPEIEEIDVQENLDYRYPKYLYLTIKYKNSLELPSWVISDGTLRLLAQTIIAYLPEKNRIYMIEEPENGLHPLAIETVYQSLSSVYDNQIFLATHSPLFLQLAKPEQLLCFSKTDDGAINIVRGEDHPRLKYLKERGEHIDLALLHGSGVLQ